MISLAWTYGLSLEALPALLFSRRARRAAGGIRMLRRAYEHVLIMAIVEGAAPAHGPYYEGYVDALEILGAKAALIARTL